MKDELSFRCWEISLQLKLEFIQLSFLSSEIYAKTVLLSLVSFFPSTQMFFFFPEALTKTLTNSIYQTKQFDKFSFLTNEIYSLVRVKSLPLSLSQIPVVSKHTH